MTPEQLKASILQCALQGKLVEQRLDEGTAEELYNQIQAGKHDLLQKGQIKKGKALPQITEDELPFELPENWKWVRVADICSIINGDRGKNYPAKSTLKKEGIPFISALNLDGRTVKQDDDLLCLSDEQYDKLGSGKLVKDDIVVCIRGSLGKHGRYPFEKGAIASSLVICRPFIHDDIMAEFFMLYLDAPLFYSQIKLYDNGTAQPNLSANSFEKFLIPLPPINEQHRIIEKIDNLIPHINRYAGAYEKLERFNTKFPEEMKKSILQYAIQGKLVEQRPEEGTAETLYRHIQEKKQKLIQEGKLKKEKALANIMEDEIPFDIPESWKWVRLSNLCKSITDGDHQPPPQTEEGYPFVVISNISYGRLDISNTRHVGEDYFNSLSEDRIAERGDLLFTVTGSYGIVIKVDTDEKFCFQRHIALLKILNCREYLFYALQSPFVKKSCDELSTGIAQKTVGLTTLRNMLIPLPPLEEQKRIVDRIEELMPLCNKLAK